MSGVVVLTGGVGGAKLVLGLSEIVPGNALTAIVNTGDDFRHFGLHVSPDIDTLLYTLSNRANPAQGWGRADESWNFMVAVGELGGDTWFRLGDGDLALHVLRTHALSEGRTLSAVTADFAQRWDIAPRILPMSDDRVATMLDTDEGMLEFQRYFVARQCQPGVTSIDFAGAAQALPAPGVIDAIESASAILIAPSNPFLSVDPVLAVTGMREAIARSAAPVVAVSPLVGGKAVKGPTAKLMQELGLPIDDRSIADHYAGVIDGMLVDGPDELPATDEAGVQFVRTPTLMVTLADRVRVARAALEFAQRLAA